MCKARDVFKIHFNYPAVQAIRRPTQVLSHVFNHPVVIVTRNLLHAWYPQHVCLVRVHSKIQKSRKPGNYTTDRAGGAAHSRRDCKQETRKINTSNSIRPPPQEGKRNRETMMLIPPRWISRRNLAEPTRVHTRLGFFPFYPSSTDSPLRIAKLQPPVLVHPPNISRTLAFTFSLGLIISELFNSA